MRNLFLTMLLMMTCIASSAQTMITHTIQRGETIENIAKRYGVSVADIENTNPSIKRFFYVGMKINIPTTSSTTTDNYDDKTYVNNGNNSYGGYGNNNTGSYCANSSGGYGNNNTGSYSANSSGGYGNNGTGSYSANSYGGYNNNYDNTVDASSNKKSKSTNGMMSSLGSSWTTDGGQYSSNPKKAVFRGYAYGDFAYAFDVGGIIMPSIEIGVFCGGNTFVGIMSGYKYIPSLSVYFIPVQAVARYYFNQNKLSPFIDANCGIAIGKEVVFNARIGGGLDFGAASFGIGYERLMVANAIYLKIGYRFGK